MLIVSLHQFDVLAMIANPAKLVSRLMSSCFPEVCNAHRILAKFALFDDKYHTLTLSLNILLQILHWLVTYKVYYSISWSLIFLFTGRRSAESGSTFDRKDWNAFFFRFLVRSALEEGYICLIMG